MERCNAAPGGPALPLACLECKCELPCNELTAWLEDELVVTDYERERMHQERRMERGYTDRFGNWEPDL